MPQDLARLSIEVQSRQVRTAQRDLRGMRDASLSAERGTKDLETATARLERRLQSTSRVMQTAGRSMTRYLTLPIGAFGGLAIRTAANFESSMNRVRAITNATGDDMQALEQRARELGATTQFSAVQAAEGMAFLSMAGFNVNQVIEAMPQVLNLAAAGQLELATASDIASNVLQGFRLDVSQTNRVVDVMAATSSRANTDIEQMGQAMSFVAPVAAGMGVDIETAAGAIGFLSDAGIQSGRAGRGLMQVMLQIGQNAEEMGVQVFDSAGNMRDFADVLDDIAAQGFNSAQIMDMFGARAGPALEILLDRGGSALRNFSNGLREAGGEAERMAEQQMEGLSGAIKELQSAFAELQLVIMEGGLLDDITALTRAATDHIRAFGEMDDETRRNIIRYGLLAAAAGPVLLILSKLITGSMAAARGVRILNAALLANPWILVAAGIATVVGLLGREYIRAQRDAREHTENLTAGIREQHAQLRELQEAISEMGVSNLEGTYRDLVRQQEELNSRVEAMASVWGEGVELSNEFLADMHSMGNTWDDINEKEEENQALLAAARRELRLIDRQLEIIRDHSEENLELRRAILMHERDQLAAMANLADEERARLITLNQQIEVIEEQLRAQRALTDAASNTGDEIERAATIGTRAMDALNFETDDAIRLFQRWGIVARGDVAEALEELDRKLDIVERKAAAMGTQFDRNAAEAMILRAAIESLIEEGIDPADNNIAVLVNRLKELRGEMSDSGTDMEGLSQSAQQVSWAFQSAFEDAIIAGNDLRSVLQGLLDDLLRVALRTQITQPLMDFTMGAVSGATESAHGNVFGSSGVETFASGGVVSGPTYFGHAGGIGLMGEAGHEAVMPLRRDSSGDLGVKATTPRVNVVINNNAHVEVRQSSHENPDGSMDIDVVIDDAIARSVAKGGKTSRAIADVFGIRRSGRIK